MSQAIKTLVVLAVLLFPAVLFGLGERPIYKIQEVRVAETAREMIERGDWLVPRFNGELRLQKPPLPYWVTALSFRISGVDERAARMPAALAGIGLAVLLWSWMRKDVSAIAAANGAIVLMTSFIGLRYFRSGEADALLLLCISIACLLGFDLLRGGGGSARRLGFGLALGLGFLSKGPAAVAIPLVTLALVTYVDARCLARPLNWRNLFSVYGTVAFLLAAFGWYGWIAWQMPEATQVFLGRQVDETFVSGNHTKHWYWYFSNWAEFYAPWGLLMVPAAVMTFRRRHQPMPDLVRYAWIWFGVVFVLLQLTVNKQMQYALLFAPPTAIILGDYLERADRGFLRVNQVLFGLFWLAVAAGVYFAIRKGGSVSEMLTWFAAAVLPFAVARGMRCNALSFPVLLLAGGVTAVMLYGETYLSKEPRKVAAQNLLRENLGPVPLVQSQNKPGDGELSFYAGRVVPPVDAAGLSDMLARMPEVWVVGEVIPDVPGASAEVVKTAGEYKLARVRRTSGP